MTTPPIGKASTIRYEQCGNTVIHLNAQVFLEPGEQDMYGAMMTVEAHFSGGNVIELDREVIGNPPGELYYPTWGYAEAKRQALQALDYARDSVLPRLDVYVRAAVERRTEQVRRANEMATPPSPINKKTQVYRR